MSVSKPMLGLAIGGTLGLLSGITIGYLARKVHSMLLGILGGLIIAVCFSFLLVLKAGIDVPVNRFPLVQDNWRNEFSRR